MNSYVPSCGGSANVPGFSTPRRFAVLSVIDSTVTTPGASGAAARAGAAVKARDARRRAGREKRDSFTGVKKKGRSCLRLIFDRPLPLTRSRPRSRAKMPVRGDGVFGGCSVVMLVPFLGWRLQKVFGWLCRRFGAERKPID